MMWDCEIGIKVIMDSIMNLKWTNDSQVLEK